MLHLHTHRVIACCLIAGLFTYLVSAGTSPPRLSQGWRMLLGGSPTIWRRSMSARSALRLWTCCCASRGFWLASSTWVSMARRTSMDTVSRVFQVSSLADKINWLWSLKKKISCRWISMVFNLFCFCRSRASGCWFLVKKVHRSAVHSHWRHPPSGNKHRLHWSAAFCWSLSCDWRRSYW